MIDLLKFTVELVTPVLAAFTQLYSYNHFLYRCIHFHSLLLRFIFYLSAQIIFFFLLSAKFIIDYIDSEVVESISTKVVICIVIQVNRHLGSTVIF